MVSDQSPAAAAATDRPCPACGLSERTCLLGGGRCCDGCSHPIPQAATAACACGHPRSQHYNTREQDFACRHGGCSCVACDTDYGVKVYTEDGNGMWDKHRNRIVITNDQEAQ